MMTMIGFKSARVGTGVWLQLKSGCRTRAIPLLIVPHALLRGLLPGNAGARPTMTCCAITQPVEKCQVRGWRLQSALEMDRDTYDSIALDG
jgi:hypothetical protein